MSFFDVTVIMVVSVLAAMFTCAYGVLVLSWWRRTSIEMKYKPADCWVGVYFDVRATRAIEHGTIQEWQHVWICILPMLPIHLHWQVYQKDRP